MKTISEQLSVKDFPLIINDKNGNKIYYENSDKDWCEREYNSDGKETYYENSNKYWCKCEYNSDGKITHQEDSNKHWYKYGYNSDGKETYFEDSDGVIRGDRPKRTFTLAEFADKLGGVPVELLRIISMIQSRADRAKRRKRIIESLKFWRTIKL